MIRAWNSDLGWRLRRRPLVIAAALVVLAFVLGALLAPWVAPTNPYDIATLDLTDARLPPLWQQGGQWPFLLGTDDQGADVVSAILFGLRVSLLVGALAVATSLVVGVALGLISGYFGGWADALIMRTADIQLTFPAFLMALLIGGITQSLLPAATRLRLALPVVILALGIAHWPHFARLVRSAARVEKTKDYVLAAQLIGRGAGAVMVRHLLPNVLNPVLVLASLDFAFAIMGEATLSFLGFGVPATRPSLGTLIRFGYALLFSGDWWLVVFPCLALVALVVAINLVSDWLRDALNPRLR